MDPHEYCRQKVAVPGSSYYYSTLFLPPERQDALNTLFALKAEIGDIPRSCTDPGVARIKLQWWREELTGAVTDQRPRHPISALVAVLAAQHSLRRQALLSIVDAAELELGVIRFPSFAALKEQYLEVTGTHWELVSELNGYEDPATPRSIKALGCAIALADSIQALHEDTRRGCIKIPQDELTRYGVQNTDLANHRDSAALRDLLALQVERARATLRAALAQIPARDRARQLNGLVTAEILCATLDEVQADGCRVLEHRTALTPLRKLWIAWRTKRSAAKRRA